MNDLIKHAVAVVREELVNYTSVPSAMLFDLIIDAYDRRALEDDMRVGALERKVEELEVNLTAIRKGDSLAAKAILELRGEPPVRGPLPEPNDLDLIEDELAVRPEAFRVPINDVQLPPTWGQVKSVVNEAWDRIMRQQVADKVCGMEVISTDHMSESAAALLQDGQVVAASKIAPDNQIPIKSPKEPKKRGKKAAKSNDRQIKSAGILDDPHNYLTAARRKLTPEERVQVIRYYGDHEGEESIGKRCAIELRLPFASVRVQGCASPVVSAYRQCASEGEKQAFLANLLAKFKAEGA